MEAGVFAKFWTPDPSILSGENLLGKLLSTGDRELVYAVEEDSVWRIAFRPGDAEKNRGSWGENLLGKAIMEARRVCRDSIAMRMCPGQYPSGEHMQEEAMFRKALSTGKLAWGVDGNLKVVAEKCIEGDELSTVRTMARVSAKHGRNSPMATIMRKLRESKRFYEENSWILESYAME